MTNVLNVLLDFPSAEKRKIMFLLHYNKKGGARNDAAVSIVLKRGLITYYSVNFRQHNTHYDFHSSDIVDVFLDAVHRTFRPQNNLSYKFQVYFEIVNQQRAPDNGNFFTDSRSWLTKAFQFKYFNEFLRGELKNEITKRFIDNGLTGSSWYFRRFEGLNVIVVPLTNQIRLITS